MFEKLFLHEVAVVELANCGSGSRGPLDLALDLVAACVKKVDATARDHCPIAVVQVGDALCQRRQRQRVAADVHFVRAETNGQWRAASGADHKVGMASEDHREGVRALQPA
jgi:hypothetical protein